MTGIQAFLEILASTGLTHLFGNPGTTELPLNDALLTDSRFRYVFGLHEIPVVAMADGYAQASGQVSVANVHISCGLGNAMGMLYNAHCAGTPLVLTAGQQDRRLRLGEPVLLGDLVSVARPWTKWAYEIERVEDIPTATRRAIQTALTPPTGPVFLSLPLDVQMEVRDFPDLYPPHIPDRRVRPPLEALKRAAERLAQAESPAILAGSRLTEADGIAELVAVAEWLGATVYAEGTSSHGRLPMPTDHPLYAGIMPLWSPEIHARLVAHDVVLAVGVNVFRLYIHMPPDCPLPKTTALIHLDNDPWQIGKNVPVEIGLLGDPKSGLAELGAMLNGYLRPEKAAKRSSVRTAQRHQAESELREQIGAQRDSRPMSPLVFMESLARVLPPNVAVVEEAITTHQNVFERLGTLRDPRGFFAHRGWALGWGIGAALGVKMAWPDRPVLGLIGDGSAMYGIQGLWSAARHNCPVTFVIANNKQYKILKVCGDVLHMPGLNDPRCPGLDLIEPVVDFVGLARSLGVEASRINEPDELSERIRESLTGNCPQLFEVLIAG